MQSAKNVIRQTLASLKRKNIEAIPSEYEKEFNSIAKIINFETKNTKKLSNIIKRLPKEEINSLDNNEILTYEDIVSILVKRPSNNKVKKVSKLMTKSLKPSVSLNLDNQINEFSLKIDNSPTLIFQNDIQMEIRKLIEIRMTYDQEILISKSNDISKLVELINTTMSDAVASSGDGYLNIKDISKQLEKIEAPTIQNILQMQKKLHGTAKNLENEMLKTNKKLEDGQNDINLLKSKIKELEYELQSTKKENEIDHLTSTLTRKAFEKYISIKEEEYTRLNQDYAIVFFDIDHFKKVNDTYGHDAGDVVLSTFAKVLLRSTREVDIISRYGGEEFIGILHFQDKKEIEFYIKRVKQLVVTNKFKYKNHKIPITFSAGLTIRSDNNSYDEAISLADELLYKAKNTGRNKIIFQDGTQI